MDFGDLRVSAHPRAGATATTPGFHRDAGGPNSGSHASGADTLQTEHLPGSHLGFVREGFRGLRGFRRLRGFRGWCGLQGLCGFRGLLGFRGLRG